MDYRVWIEDAQDARDGERVEAPSESEAAERYACEHDGDMFPDQNDGDRCVLRAAEWTELSDDFDAPLPVGTPYEFVLRVRRSVERCR